MNNYRRTTMIGECGKHPGNSWVNCPMCEMEHTNELYKKLLKRKIEVDIWAQYDNKGKGYAFYAILRINEKAFEVEINRDGLDNDTIHLLKKFEQPRMIFYIYEKDMEIMEDKKEKIIRVVYCAAPTTGGKMYWSYDRDKLIEHIKSLDGFTFIRTRYFDYLEEHIEIK